MGDGFLYFGYFFFEVRNLNVLRKNVSVLEYRGGIEMIYS